MKKLISIAIVALVVLFVLIQFLPVGLNHENPPILKNAPWGDPEAEVIARRSCYDCHSNETTWPWYSTIAPVSWLVQHDVQEGRDKLNFSEWGQGEQEIDEIGETVREGEMPLRFYLITHPDAKLTDSDRETLVQNATALGGGESGEGAEDEDSEE